MEQRTLWTFGDSMTFGHGCNPDCHSNIKNEYLKYKKQGDNIWPNHLGTLLNCEVKNFGKNGISNDTIFDTIVDNYNNIKENDIVIINMTIHGRIEVPYKEKTYRSPASYESVKLKKGQTYDDIKKFWIDDEFNDIEPEIVEALINYQYYFSDHDFYRERNSKRFEFIKDRFYHDKKVNFCFLWGLEESEGILRTFQTIKQHTNGEIKDNHFSFNGHYEFSHFLNSLINKSKLI
jgi:hypothetical protein